MPKSYWVGHRLTDQLPADMLEMDQWRRRVATLVGAVLVGLIAVAFAQSSDWAQEVFRRFDRTHPYWVLGLTPAAFVLFALLTRRLAPESRGSGIPQVIAASRDPSGGAAGALTSFKASVAKFALTFGGLLFGASVGREGPTVQVGAAVMAQIHRVLKVPLTSGVLIAGGAAGVAAAFNTPLAGIAFAIEELAVAYEQRVAVLAMGAVMISGLTSQGVAGSYIYFGRVAHGLPLSSVLLAAPLAGIVGGFLGGLFSRMVLALRGPNGLWSRHLDRRPLVTAGVCGIIVAVLGVLTHGLTWGTGYEATRSLLTEGSSAPWFGPAKMLATLATAVSGIPGGIFAPSLATGAGIGELLTPLFPPEQAGAIVMLGMAGYFVGVVRAPLTAVIVIGEATGSSATAILPLFATALIGDWMGSMVCKDRLYHALAKDFLPKKEADKADKKET